MDEEKTYNPFERSLSNPLYKKYKSKLKRKLANDREDDHEFKCFLVKRYCRDMRLFSLLRISLGLLVIILTVVFFSKLSRLRFSGPIISLLFIGGLFYAADGFGKYLAYSRMSRNNRQLAWEDEDTQLSQWMREYFTENYPSE